MRNYISLALVLLAVAGCGKSAKAPPKIENVAANQMNGNDVTEVPDESGDDNDSGNNSVDPD